MMKKLTKVMKLNAIIKFRDRNIFQKVTNKQRSNIQKAKVKEVKKALMEGPRVTDKGDIVRYSLLGCKKEFLKGFVVE